MPSRTLLWLTLFAVTLAACSGEKKSGKKSDSGYTDDSGRQTATDDESYGSVGTNPAISVSGKMADRRRQLAQRINKVARQVGTDPYFVHAIITQESAYKPNAKSHAGAMGLMQLMPGTARRFNVSSPFVPEQNVRGGATYLKWLLKEFGGDMQLAAAGYNAGEGNVRKYGRNVPPFEETKAYVPIVLKNFNTYKQNPHLIGLGDSESPTAGSGCDARELC